VSSYLNVFTFCLILTVIAIVVAVIGLNKPGGKKNGGQVPHARPRHAVR